MKTDRDVKQTGRDKDTERRDKQPSHYTAHSKTKLFTTARANKAVFEFKRQEEEEVYVMFGSSRGLC